MKKTGWAQRTAALIKKHGSVEAVAAEMGVSYFTVLRWRKGSSVPSPLAQAKFVELEQMATKK